MIRSNLRNYKRGSTSGVNRRYMEIALGVIVVLVIAVGLLAYFLFFGSTTDTRLRDVMLDQARGEYTLAHESASQLSRTGGSSTMRMLSQARQHVYTIGKINTLCESLLDGNRPLISQEPIEQALAYISTCESLLLAGQYIDTPLNALWEQLTLISAEIEALY